MLNYHEYMGNPMLFLLAVKMNMSFVSRGINISYTTNRCKMLLVVPRVVLVKFTDIPQNI